MPKEPKTFNWPRLYVREIVLRAFDASRTRIIIIYPDDKPAEYIGGWWHQCCWWRMGYSPEESVRAMYRYTDQVKKYGNHHKFDLVFLGEIK